MIPLVIDTGCANLNSVKNAIIKIGYKPKISNSINDIENAEKIILPGVGTVCTAIDTFKKKKIFSSIKNFKKPILGICLGMQLFFKYSEENKNIPLLNIIPKLVYKISGKHVSVPHMGWNTVSFNSCKHILFKNIPNHSYFYFAHSYVVGIDKLYTISSSVYNTSFSSVIQKNNFFGVQFHPEKSGKFGLQLLKNFLEI